MVNRSFPACIVFGSPTDQEAIETCRTLKGEAFSAVIPVIFIDEHEGRHGLQAMEAGADELLTADMTPDEQAIRLQVTLNRANRDVSVHPSTRLPGTAQIERDITERIRSGELFAVCYADLDHFKEFNDRYGYNRGDGVIGIVSRILRDVVKAYAPSGFIGHIGGDDFIFNVPLDSMEICCREILAIFDELIPYQYTEEDRKEGHFLARDRRGALHRIPLMTLSIGVVTNRNRTFSHPARVSELATEMKAYAKTLEGSVHAVDRRSDPEPLPIVGEGEETPPPTEP
ncbi:MAG: diguanylate cyclase [Gemmatimonadetes bacterium]|nr:diguanylate cyclase [Gemmatimonadota bacterium]NIU74715.1 diguanylate cyclase [Gammaproteobacteria bacterium]NIP79725.1 diguanylate cyclase [Gemmatimonadota bacterium]NIQ54513.1 diguanylate cyclase [Gemmatimonadota bacterium]NIV60565.1 diguanylate cyclase [Gemmatimonadota bacterium]